MSGLNSYQLAVATLPPMRGGSPMAIPMIEPLGGSMPGTDVPASYEQVGSPQGSSAPPTEAGGSQRFSLGGLGEFASADNTSTHVAILVGVALAVIVALHVGGFRFAVDAGVTRI